MKKVRLGKLQKWILCDLFLNQHINRKEIYKEGYSYSTLFSSLKSLEVRGLIKRNSNILELTDKGRTVVEELEEE